MNICSTPKQVGYLKEGFLRDYFVWRCSNDLIHEKHSSFKEQCQNYGCWQLPSWKTSSQNEHYDPMTSREKQNKTVHVANNKICILGQTENWENLDLVSDLDSFLILKDFSDKIEVELAKAYFFFHIV